MNNEHDKQNSGQWRKRSLVVESFVRVRLSLDHIGKEESIDRVEDNGVKATEVSPCRPSQTFT